VSWIHWRWCLSFKRGRWDKGTLGLLRIKPLCYLADIFRQISPGLGFDLFGYSEQGLCDAACNCRNGVAVTSAGYGVTHGVLVNHGVQRAADRSGIGFRCPLCSLLAWTDVVRGELKRVIKTCDQALLYLLYALLRPVNHQRDGLSWQAC
jgi:hypothetical protein